MLERYQNTSEALILHQEQIGALAVTPDVVYFAAEGETTGGGQTNTGNGGQTSGGEGTGVGGTSSRGGEVIREYKGPGRRGTPRD